MGFQIGAKRFQIGAEITNQGKRDFKSGQGLQINSEHTTLYQFLKNMNMMQLFCMLA